jgi:acyl carrier protein
MNEGNDVRVAVRAILDAALPEGLPAGWSDERPLADAGLDSVAVLEIVGALESRLGISLRDEDLDARHFETADALVALAERRKARA